MQKNSCSNMDILLLLKSDLDPGGGNKLFYIVNQM